MNGPGDRDELIKELMDVRRRGISRIESPDPRHRKLELPILRELASRYGNRQDTFVERAKQLILQAIKNIRDATQREIGLILFDFIEELPRYHKKRQIEDRSPDELRGHAKDHYADMMGMKDGMGLDAFRKGPELEILNLIAAEIETIAHVNRGQVQPTAEELLIDRSLLHVVRTLEARKKHARTFYAFLIDQALTYYREWHEERKHSPFDVLEKLDTACKWLIQKSLYELVGGIRVEAQGPTYPPNVRLPWCNYPNGVSLEFVNHGVNRLKGEGGTDPYTGQKVQPFYAAVFPVTIYEWCDFLQKFDWPVSGTIEGTFNTSLRQISQSGYRKWPAFGMTYYDCVAYCFWLWATTPYRFRLPTEAEWNYAALGGRANCRYPWGSNPRSDQGWFSTTRANVRTPIDVDATPPTGPHKLVGLGGNVWEYTSTLWREPQPVDDSDITIPDLPFMLASKGWWEAEDRIYANVRWREEVKLVMKGGSWGSGPEYAAMGQRIYSSFFNYGAYGGFRLVVSAVRDPETGKYRPEPSPLLDTHLRQVRVVSSTDFAGTPEREGRTTVSVCGMTIECEGSSSLAIPDASWDQLVRRRHEQRSS